MKIPYIFGVILLEIPYIFQKMSIFYFFCCHYNHKIIKDICYFLLHKYERAELNEILTNLCWRKRNHRFQPHVEYLHILADAKQENKGRNFKQPTYNQNRPI